MGLKELHMKRNKASDEYRNIITKVESDNRTVTPHERGKLDQLLDNIKSIDNDIAKEQGVLEERVNELDEIITNTPVTARIHGEGEKENMNTTEYIVRPDGTRSRLYSATEKMNIPDPGIDGIRAHELSFGKYIRGLVTGNWKGAEAEQRVAGSTPGSAGGLLIPITIALQMIEAARKKTKVISAGAKTFQMGSAKEIFAKVTTSPTVYNVPEGNEITESDMAISPVTFEARQMAAIVRIPIPLIQDAANIQAIIEELLSIGMAQGIDYACLSGSGIGEPLGILSCSDIGRTSISSPANNAVMGYMVDGCYELIDENIDPAEISCLYNSTFGKTLSKAVDGTGAYFGSGNTPDVYGAMRRFTTNQIDNTEAGESPVIFGRFSDLMIGVRENMSIATSEVEGDSFKKNMLAIRIVYRGDSQPVIPANFHIANFS